MDDIIWDNILTFLHRWLEPYPGKRGKLSGMAADYNSAMGEL